MVLHTIAELIKPHMVLFFTMVLHITSSYTGNFTGDFTGNFVGDYAGTTTVNTDYVGNYSRSVIQWRFTAVSYTRNRASTLTYAGNYACNYTRHRDLLR